MNTEFLSLLRSQKTGTEVERRKMEGLTNLGYNTNIHGSVIVKLSVEICKQICLFFKDRGQEDKTGPSRSWY
jgi:hypothetical protein